MLARLPDRRVPRRYVLMAGCKDCAADGITTTRAAPHPGPRCTSHHRAVRRARSARAHDLRVEKFYGITAADYDLLYDSQNGVCFICRRARGLSKRLSVDHDHGKGCGHLPEVGCRYCVRALLCSTCNRVVVGRYDAPALARAITVLLYPPAQQVLNPTREDNG